MADLGNQKIKDTYQLVLQTDASGNLQNLSGGTPYPLILNSGLTVVGAISATTDIYANNLTIAGDITSVGDDITMADDLSLTTSGARILFTGAVGGGTEGVLYTDTGSVQRYGLLFPGLNVVAIANRAADGVVQIRANTSTGGSGGEVTVAEFQDDLTTINANLTVTGNTNISGSTSYIGAVSGTGSVTAIGGFVGNASTSTKIDSITNTDIVQLTSAQTLTNKTLTSPVLTTPNIGTPSVGNLGSCTAYPGDSSLVTAGVVTTGTWASNRKFELPNPSVVANGEGDIVYFGVEMDTTPGAIYFYNTDRAWELTNATGNSTSNGLLAVALGDNNTLTGMLIRGMVSLASNPGSTSRPIYLSETPGRATTEAPAESGSIVRVLGYSLGEDTAEIWFDPDKTWVELT